MPLTNVNNPKISIIIPVYNTEKYLQQCLDSVVNQTLAGIEIICVNDGSTDKSLCILKEYEEKYERIKVLSYKRNRGAGFARNKALKVAKGEYLAFVDSDDFLNFQVLEKIYNKCKNENADVGICSAKFYDVLDNESHDIPWALKTHLLPKKDCFSAREIYYCIFSFSQNWNCNKIFKHSFIKNNKIKFQNIYRTNDMLFTSKALVQAERITILNEPLFFYRVNHGTSCQQTNYLYPLDFYKAFKELKKWLIKVNLYKKVKESYTEWALVGCVCNINSIKNEKIRNKVCNKVFRSGIYELGLDKHNECIVEEENRHKEFDLLFEQFKLDRQKKRKDIIRGIFSLRNSVDKKHKVITILNIKIKLRKQQ